MTKRKNKLLTCPDCTGTIAVGHEDTCPLLRAALTKRETRQINITVSNYPTAARRAGERRTE